MQIMFIDTSLFFMQGADSTTSLALSLDSKQKLNKDGHNDAAVHISVSNFDDGPGIGNKNSYLTGKLY